MVQPANRRIITDSRLDSGVEALVKNTGGVGPLTSAALSATVAKPKGATIQHRFDGTGANEPGVFLAWTFDDGYNAAVAYFAAMNIRGIKGTLFLTKNWVNKAGTEPTWNDTYITQAQVQAIADAGHEIGTHGVNHEDQSAYRQTNGDAAFSAFVDTQVDYIESTFGVTVKTGAFPAGRSDRRTREIMARRHEFYRGTKGVTANYGQNPFDVVSVDVQALTEAAIKVYVDEAIANASMLVFLIHGVASGAQAAMMTKLGNVMDYATSLGVRQGTFYQGMSERTVFRGSAGAMVDSSGNAFFRALKSTRLEIARSDEVGETAWFDIEETTNVPFFDASGGQPFEFRKGVRLTAPLEVGQRSVFNDAVLNSTTTVTSASAAFEVADQGRTITGTGIPVDATIVTRVSATQVTISAAATATASAVTITLGRPVAPAAAFANDVNMYGNFRIRNSGAAQLRLSDLAGTDTAFFAAASFGRSGAGGAMTWDTGTGGSTATIKAAKIIHTDQTGVRKISLAGAQPSDASINSGEQVVYPVPTTGAAKYAIRSKETDGTVRQVLLNLTPVALAAAATDAATTQTLANDLRTKLIATGMYS